MKEAARKEALRKAVARKQAEEQQERARQEMQRMEAETKEAAKRAAAKLEKERRDAATKAAEKQQAGARVPLGWFRGFSRLLAFFARYLPQAMELLSLMSALPPSAINDALDALGNADSKVRRSASSTVQALLGASNCVVCLERRPTIAVQPCGHRCLCAVDAPQFVGKACPICRGPVGSVQAIYDA